MERKAVLADELAHAQVWQCVWGDIRRLWLGMGCWGGVYCKEDGCGLQRWGPALQGS